MPRRSRAQFSSTSRASLSLGAKDPRRSHRNPQAVTEKARAVAPPCVFDDQGRVTVEFAARSPLYVNAGGLDLRVGGDLEVSAASPYAVRLRSGLLEELRGELTSLRRATRYEPAAGESWGTAEPSTVKEGVRALRGRQAVLEATVSTATGDVATLEARMDSAESRLDALEAAQTALQSTVSGIYAGLHTLAPLIFP